MNVWEELRDTMNRDGINAMRPHAIIPESFENAYSYFEDIAYLYNKVNNITVDANKIWKPTVSQSGVISWNKSEDDNQPTPVSIRGPQGLQGNQGPQGPRGNEGARGPAGNDGAPGVNGEDGFSPYVNITAIPGGHRMNVTDANGTQSFNIMDGTPGEDNTNVWMPTVSDNGVISWEKSNSTTPPTPVNITGPQGEQGEQGPAGNDGAPGVNGINGINGTNGADGFSPTVSIIPIDNGNRITIVDRDGGHTFNVYDGAPGEPGAPGANGTNGINGINGTNGTNGADGFSPYVNLTPIENGTQVNITDANGTHSFNVYNGAQGEQGEQGPRGNDGAPGANGINGINGTNGTNGADGFSPTVSISAITGGNRITITDRDGGHTFNVYDGINGTNGTNGTNGRDGTNGTNGSDGFSPVIQVTALNDGTRNYNRVNITSAGGTNSFNVYDGTNGSGGGGSDLSMYPSGSSWYADNGGDITNIMKGQWIVNYNEVINRGFKYATFVVAYHGTYTVPLKSHRLSQAEDWIPLQYDQTYSYPTGYTDLVLLNKTNGGLQICVIEGEDHTVRTPYELYELYFS